jgi:hypothetical protein
VVNLPHFWYLALGRSNSYHFGGTYWHRQTTFYITYHHIRGFQTFNYYSDNGSYLDSHTIYGYMAQNWSYQVPYTIGNYCIDGSDDYYGYYNSDDFLNVGYHYVPPITHYYTSNPNAGTYYTNGLNYEPIYLAPSRHSGSSSKSSAGGFNPDGYWEDYSSEKGGSPSGSSYSTT